MGRRLEASATKRKSTAHTPGLGTGPGLWKQRKETRNGDGVTFGGRADRMWMEERADAGLCAEGEAGEVGGVAKESAAWMGGTVCDGGVWLGVGGVCVGQLEIFGGAGVFGKIWCVGGGDFLFCGVRRPIEAEALSGMAGGEFGGRERRERGKD